MLTTLQPRKTKIALSDYSYLQDIESRILMAQLSVFEVKVLQEIIHHSLKIPVDQLAQELYISQENLIPILDKLSETKLFKRVNTTLFVDKEMRKYYEFQLEKFDEDFEPDLDFLQNVLSKVPIHVLPVWYSIPRMSNNIFESIVERYFATPKVYFQYLNELHFENPVLNSMVKDVFQAPRFEVNAAYLMEKYDLSREQFEEYLLLLEYHFACCLRYRQVDDYWQEVVTPFSEIYHYLKHESQARVHAIREPIEQIIHADFMFIEDLATFLKACQGKKAHPKDVRKASGTEPEYSQKAVDKLLQVGYAAKNADGSILCTAKGSKWLTKTLSERIAHLASDPLNVLADNEYFEPLWNHRNVHSIEKKLRKLVPYEWLELDRFIAGFTAPLGQKTPVTLERKGKKWRYRVPSHTEHEKEFIQVVIMERLGELGVVYTGMHHGKPVFCLTPFGSNFIH